MVFSTRLPAWLLAFVTLMTSILPANALYFYMDSASPKCFYEELPKDTLVVGQSRTHLTSPPSLTAQPTKQLSHT